jgi:hypothetical protein
MVKSMTKNLGSVKRHRYAPQAGDMHPTSIGHETRETGHGHQKSKAKSSDELKQMTGIEPA